MVYVVGAFAKRAWDAISMIQVRLILVYVFGREHSLSAGNSAQKEVLVVKS